MITRICVLFLMFTGVVNLRAQKSNLNVFESSYWHWAASQDINSNVALYSSAFHISYMRQFLPITDRIGLGMGVGYLLNEGDRAVKENRWLGNRDGISIFSNLAFQNQEKRISPIANLKTGYLRTHLSNNQVKGGAGAFLLQFSGGASYKWDNGKYGYLSLGISTSRDTWFIPLSLGFSW